MQDTVKLIYIHSLVALSEIRSAVHNLSIGAITKEKSLELIVRALDHMDKENEGL